MNSLSSINESSDGVELRKSFLKWQCRVRQSAMRENAGQPDDGIMPVLKLKNTKSPLGSIITLIHKRPQFSVTSELTHMVKKTMDLAQRRDQAVQFLSSTYYQKYVEFSDTLTATFEPRSRGASNILQSGTCLLIFDAFNQRYDINCEVRRLSEDDPLYKSTIAHNSLFNSYLHPATIVLGFEPKWNESSSSNSFAY
ncbi:MAG: hypothetical protein CML40_08555 [Rhodobacteraceae bacterium]|nr:MAG: hypothetical protein CML40_08555 [Paracoccaceae bacterium]